MTANQWLTLIVTAITDFIITFGTAMTAVLTQAPDKLPGTAAWIAALLGAAASSARAVQKSLSLPVNTPVVPQQPSMLIRPQA